MWDKIVAGIVAILLIGLAVGALVPSAEGGEGEHGGVTSLTLVVENADKDTSETVTLEIPGTVSVTSDLLRSAGITDNPSAFTTISDPDKTWGEDDLIKVHAIADVWWSSDKIDSIDRISYTQQAYGEDGEDYPWVSNNGNEVIETEVTSDIALERSETDPRSISPSSEYFVEWDYGGLSATKVDGGSIDGEVRIVGTDVNGNTIEDRVSISATISLDIEDDGSLSLGAELTEAETTSS